LDVSESLVSKTVNKAIGCEIMPSWVVDLSRKPFREAQDGKMIRYNPSPLVGAMGSRGRAFKASGSEPMIVDFSPGELPAQQMTAKGFKVCTIEYIWASAEFGNVPAVWLKVGGWRSVQDYPPDELWRTLVANRNRAGDEPDPSYPAILRSAVKDRGINYGIRTDQLIHQSATATVSEVFHRVQDVVWRRKLFRTEREYMELLTGNGNVGALGLAPDGANKGDCIVVLFGCSVPLVLRPIEIQGQTTYKIIGECYVDCMMDGEALAYRQAYHQTKTASIQEEAEKLSKKARTLGERAEGIGERAKDVEKDAEGLTKETESIKKEAESIEKKAGTLREAAEMLRTEAETLRSEAGALKGQAEALRAETESVQEVEILREEAGRLRKEVGTLRDEIAIFRTKSETLMGEIFILV